MCESLNLIISRLHCWAVELKAIIKRSEVESSLSCSLTVACMMCQCAVLLKTKITISDMFDMPSVLYLQSFDAVGWATGRASRP